LEALGFAREGRPFHPHLTLLRIRKLENRQTFARFIQRHSGVSFGDLRVAELVLFESLLKPQGAEYNVLGRAELRSGPK
jgi:2'-5' RNA ligase